MIFLIIVTNGYVLVTLVGAFTQNHDFCFRIFQLQSGNFLKHTLDCNSSISAKPSLFEGKKITPVNTNIFWCVNEYSLT